MPMISTLVLIALLLVPMVGASASPSQPNGQAQDATGEITSLQDGVKVAASQPWTKEEMLAAIPYPFPTEKDSAAVVDVIVPAAEVGETGFIPGGLPQGESLEAVVEVAGPLMEVTAGESVEGYSYPPGNNRYVLYPYVTVGKLFFRQRGVSYVCSASAAGRNAILTAGHCVHDGSNSTAGWSSNVVFVPAYRNGTSPRGQWTASWLATKTAWYQSSNFRYDLGGAVLYKRNNQTISQVVGYLGFAWNQSYDLHWNVFGYPAGAPFNGQLMWTCQASLAYQGTPSGSGPRTKGIGCDMTGGSSGGPWIWKFSGGSGATNYLNGVTSYRRSGYSQELYSPHFDSTSKSLRDLVVNGNP
jgi:V8-like Glu-specific endopeptidase